MTGSQATPRFASEAGPVSVPVLAPRASGPRFAARRSPARIPARRPYRTPARRLAAQ